ncbi:MAG TPA: NAD-dependent epimerase/dehydratase family protein, partial [Gemmatimonadales bacterium]|nr:NAD-dependent epimerase/dehydratase family protein [Gemmatimonadales bacterium]
MFINRRAFVQFTVASGAAATLAGPLAAIARARPSLAKPMHILILGGTGFLGPATIEAALARGHTVTIFNRGRTEKRRKEIGRELPFMDKVETLYGNRDPEKHADDADPESPKGLSSLIGRTFDAVIDNSGYVPRIVRASAELLAPHTKQYVFISSISRYADNSRPGSDETAPAATMPDPAVEDMGAQFENYGPLKALCEDAAEQAMPGRVAVVRPGYIVGPGDPTPRFTYWPVRLGRASGERAEVAVPGAPDDPVQIIDVRDLGDWLITLVETGTTGAFNACGPEHRLTAAALMAACREAAGAT